MLAFESTTPLYNRSLSASSTRRLVLAHETAIKAHFFPLILDFKSQQDIKELVTTPRWRHTIGVARPQGCCVAMHHFAFWGGGYCYCCHCQRRCDALFPLLNHPLFSHRKQEIVQKRRLTKGCNLILAPPLKGRRIISLCLFSLAPTQKAFGRSRSQKSITPAHRP